MKCALPHVQSELWLKRICYTQSGEAKSAHKIIDYSWHDTASMKDMNGNPWSTAGF